LQLQIKIEYTAYSKRKSSGLLTDNMAENNLKMSIEGGTADLGKAFNSTGFTSGGIRNVTPRQALDLCNLGAIMLDVRQPYMTDFKVADVPVQLLIPFNQLPDRTGEIEKESYIICIDSVGLKSHDSWLMLTERGFTNVLNVAGGIVEWERDGLPLRIDNSKMLTGSCACQLKSRRKPL